MSGASWKTIAEVTAPETSASISLYTLNPESRYMFRVFAVNARGLGHASDDSDSFHVSGDYRHIALWNIFIDRKCV